MATQQEVVEAAGDLGTRQPMLSILRAGHLPQVPHALLCAQPPCAPMVFLCWTFGLEVKMPTPPVRVPRVAQLLLAQSLQGCSDRVIGSQPPNDGVMGSQPPSDWVMG